MRKFEPKKFSLAKLHKLMYVFYLLIFVGAILRVYNITWGAPYFFHPDERNIASAVTRISPENFNPEFFAYGSLPIYAIYATGVLVNFLQNTGDSPINIFSVSFENAIVISRIFSSLFSIGIILLLFKVRKFLSGFAFGVTLLTSVFSVGFIQYAHFGTFEMWLTFFTFLLFIFFVYFLQEKKLRYYFFAAVVFGILVSVKVSSSVLIVSFPLILFLYFKKLNLRNMIKNIFLYTIAALLITIDIFLISNPYFLLDNSSYLSSLSYESGVATGNLYVFYTGRFFETIPVIFQVVRVFPFLINPLNTLLLVVSILIMTYLGVRKRDVFILLTLAFFFLVFISQAFLFVKWNRYMVPALPFIYILIGILSGLFIEKAKVLSQEMRRWILLGAVSFFSILFSFSFFITTYFSDTRVEAAQWAMKNIPSDAKIASEVYDLGVVPFESHFSSIKLLNTYELDNEEEVPSLDEYEYFLLPSPRILRSRMQLPDKFPKGHEFYKKIFSEDGDFRLIYNTPCDLLCKITYLGDPIFFLEETANVFDRPTVLIYEKKN